jgi:methylated-DNA-[protein]-cysteine S-methyltransferase
MPTSHSDFNEKCYALLMHIPEGKVTTYMEIARALNTTACRAVGSAMAKNKHLVSIPCHRVVRSDGCIGQYALGADIKSALLLAEGVPVKNGKVLNLPEVIHRFAAR